LKILTDMTRKLMQKLEKGHLEWVQQAIKSFVAHLEATGDVSTDNALFTSSTDPETLWKLILDEHRWLRFLAVRLLAIVPHATDVERLFIMMGCFNSDRRATKEGGPGNAGQGEDVPGQHEDRVQVVHVTQDPTLRFAAVQYQDLCNILFHYRPLKPKKERNALSVHDTSEQDAEQIAEGAEAEEAVETSPDRFAKPPGG
jgi:hypothetical protein